MSHHSKFPGTAPPAAPPLEVHRAERERVAKLIALKKSGHAVDVAKEIHRRCKTAASEELLLDAYGARMASLIGRGLDREAAALMELLRGRYCSAGERLHEWNAAIGARHGDFSGLLEPLNDPALPAEKQAAIAATVRREVTDLRALAECRTLAPEHPLHIAAQALHRAFEAVTTGPVAEETLVLPEVSRSSPLAPWKVLVRAIARYYRAEDELCGKCLAAIDPDAAVYRLVPPLLALIHKPQSLSLAATALVNRAGGSFDSLRGALKKLDSTFDRGNQALILQEIRNAVAVWRQAEAGLVTRLKQHIVIRAMVAGLKAEKVALAMDGPALKDAYFWRLLARANEDDSHGPNNIALACIAWEEFRRHAIDEGWFAARSPEAAAVYLRMADQLQRLDPDALHRMRIRMERQPGVAVDYYQSQPPEIRSLMVSSKDLYFLDPDRVLERACEADPCRENFQHWLRYAEEESPRTRDLVAERWCNALPNDIAPLLHLMHSAEQRSALQKALKFMERAERIDGLNPEVRRARLRLLVSIAVRHLREKKSGLGEKELRQIEGLPQAQQGDRPAFLAALRFVRCQLTNDKVGSAAAFEEAKRLLGDAAIAHLLFLHVECWCGVKSSALGKAPAPTTPLFAAFGRVCAIGDDVGMRVDLMEPMPVQLIKELSAPNVSGNPRALAALGEAAIRQQCFPVAYAVAGAGLAQGAESHAGFLFLRARALPPYEAARRGACVAAASELARRQHDHALLQRIGEWRYEIMDWVDVPEHAVAAPDDGEIGRTVDREIRDQKFPDEAPADVDDEQCDCPVCRAEPNELPAQILEILEQIGPQAMAQTLAEMLDYAGKKKRGRRRPPVDNFDLPF
jgi:hypothetical protein